MTSPAWCSNISQLFIEIQTGMKLEGEAAWMAERSTKMIWTLKESPRQVCKPTQTAKQLVEHSPENLVVCRRDDLWVFCLSFVFSFSFVSVSFRQHLWYLLPLRQGPPLLHLPPSLQHPSQETITNYACENVLTGSRELNEVSPTERVPTNNSPAVTLHTTGFPRSNLKVCSFSDNQV